MPVNKTLKSFLIYSFTHQMNIYLAYVSIYVIKINQSIGLYVITTKLVVSFMYWFVDDVLRSVSILVFFKTQL